MRQSLLVLTLLASTALAEDPSVALRVYVPRSLQVQAIYLDLGDICIVRCEDEALLRKASAVHMGRGPFSRETLLLTRANILSRLGACGLATQNVQFSGSETVSLTRTEQALGSQELTKAAQEFLAKTKPAPEGRLWRLVRPPSELMVPQLGQLQLVPRLAKQETKDDSRIKVEVAVTCDQRELAVAELTFQAQYLTQQAVAARDLPAGTTLKTEDFKVLAVAVDAKPARQWLSPLGQQVTQAIEAGKVIQPSAVRLPKLEILVRRDQGVKMMIEGPGFVITAMGQAMENGRPGETIRVKNVDSQQLVNCYVAADGTAHPIFEESKP